MGVFPALLHEKYNRFDHERIVSGISMILRDVYGFESMRLIDTFTGENVVLKVNLDGLCYAVKIISNNRDVNLDNVYAFMSVCGDNGIPVPSVQLTRYGEAFCRCADACVIIYNWQDGVMMPCHAVDVSWVNTVADVLCHIHKVGENLDKANLFPAVNMDYSSRIQSIPALFQHLSDLSFYHEMQSLLSEAMIADKAVISQFAKMPLRTVLTHEELRGDNIIVDADNGKICCILDWEGSRRQSVIDSIAQTALWCQWNPKEENLLPPKWGFVEDFIDRCLSVNSLSNAEIDMFPYLVLLHTGRSAAFWPDRFIASAGHWIELINNICKSIR